MPRIFTRSLDFITELLYAKYMRNVVKVRIYPNSEQAVKLTCVFGSCRWVWNNSLALMNQLYRETGKSLTRNEIKARLPQLKKEYPWLKNAYSQVLQSVCLKLSQAFINFFERRSKYPRFKSKHGRQSVQYPQHVKLDTDKIQLPGGIGWMKAKIHRTFEGKLKTVTVSLNPSGEYYASLLFENDESEPTPSTQGKAVGIDLGVNHFAVTSDGLKFANPKHKAKHERNLQRKQQKLARKKKGSRSAFKAKRLVAKVHQRVANTRKDFVHKLSHRLVSENQVIAVESLFVLGMVKNHKLAKAISDCGWSTFVGMLNYKCSQQGKVLVQVDRFFPSSKTCSCCLYQIAEMPLEIRSWQCPSCGSKHDRDINAAKNILCEGLRILSCGRRETARVRSKDVAGVSAKSNLEQNLQTQSKTKRVSAREASADETGSRSYTRKS